MASVLSLARWRPRRGWGCTVRGRSSAAWAFALAPLLGCAGAAPAASAASVIAWAVGPAQRDIEPPPGDRFLLALPSNQPSGAAIKAARPVLPGCFEATAFLPAPAPDPRLFFLRAGAISVSRTKQELPALLSGSDRALRITRLLAFVKDASPLELLVAAIPEGTKEEQLWRLAIEERAIQSQTRVTAERGVEDPSAFFARHDVPRCRSGGRRCLVLSSDDSAWYLDLEPVRGQPQRPFQALSGQTVVDAAWAPAGEDEGTVYLLVPCPEKKG